MLCFVRVLAAADEIVKELPNLPPGILLTIALSTLCLQSGPKIYEVFRDFRSDENALRREKERLQLLKLLYEIEILRKEHNLSELVPVPRSTLTVIAQSENKARPPFTYLPRFIIGGMGGVISVLIFVAKSDITISPFHISRIGFVEGWLAIGALGGGSICCILQRDSKPFVYMWLGCSCVLWVAIIASI